MRFLGAEYAKNAFPVHSGELTVLLQTPWLDLMGLLVRRGEGAEGSGRDRGRGI